jgi:AcrR family transcriptional regulator
VHVPGTRGGAGRRTVIADAAIQLIATGGPRALTHRAVDTAAELPPGSTSYYFRTRDALLAACVHRMLERDLTAAGPAAGSGLADLLVGTVLTQVRDRREDLLARYQLSFEASRRPELQAALVQAGRNLRELLGGLLTAYGVADGPAAAWPLAAAMDGLMYDRVAGAGTALRDDEFEAGVRRAIAAVLAGLVQSRPVTATKVK